MGASSRRSNCSLHLARMTYVGLSRLNLQSMTCVKLTCIALSDTHARGTNPLECNTTTTKGRRTWPTSRQVHRRVQARDRRLRDLDEKADLGMLQGTGPRFQDGQPMGDKAQAEAFRPARPKGRGSRAARGAQAHTRARDGERVPEKAAAFLI